MERKNNNVLICILVLSLAMLWFKYEKLKAENRELQNEVENYQQALDEANSNIEDANSNIEEAKNEAGGDYDDMESALESLETVDTVSP